MFDYHMHSRVSFDGQDTGLSMARAAAKAGLTEICFTDHIDYDPFGTMGNMAFDTDEYSAEYDSLAVPGLKIRRGMEFGMTSDEFATRLLNAKKVAVVPGAAFGDCGEGFLRISYAYSLDDLKEALDRVEEFIAELRAEQS